MPEKIAFIRPAKETDLKQLHLFAEEAGPGITSLPRDIHSLKTLMQKSFKENYLFCLELENQAIGFSGIIPHIGVDKPFFAFHKKIETFASSSIKFAQQFAVLHFIEAKKKPTEIGTLYLQKNFRKMGYGTLLSLSRFLFIALFKNRFSSLIIAELRGVNYEGFSPFWESLGALFFGMDFPKADELRHKIPNVIQELFPKHPIYTILLPIEAQEIIGNVHPVTIPAKKMLEKQGFRSSDYVDILDAGPHFYAHTDAIDAIKNSKRKKIDELTSNLTSRKKALVANTQLEFRCCISPFLVHNDRVILPIEVGDILNVDVEDEIIYYELS